MKYTEQHLDSRLWTVAELKRALYSEVAGQKTNYDPVQTKNEADCRATMPTGKQAKGQREQKGAGASSNLEQGGDVRVRPESRLREMETLVKTQWINNQNGRVTMSEPNQGYHPSCKQK